MSAPSSSSDGSAVPSNNPILTSYESFVRDTPLVTRYMMTAQVVSFLLSCFFLFPSMWLGTVPYKVLFHFQWYRLLTAPLVCDSIWNLIFAYLAFVTFYGKRMEYGLGSTAYLWFLMTIAVVTNLLFCLVCLSMHLMTIPMLLTVETTDGDDSSSSSAHLWNSSHGIWTVLFGVMAVECSRAPADSMRRLFFFEVPTRWYPLAVFGFFCLFGGFRLSYILSIGVGNAYAHGHLDKLKLDDSRFRRWEETVLRNFSQREGWVVGHAATGDWSIPDQRQQQQQQQQGNNGSASWLRGLGGGGGSVRQDDRASASQGPQFPTTGGHTLGSTPGTSGSSNNNRSSTTTGNRQRRTGASAEARAAMLEAAERRARQQQKKEQEDQVSVNDGSV